MNINLRCLILLLLILASFHTSFANFLSEHNVMSGIMFPDQIIAKEGSDINLKLVNPFEAPQICKYRLPKSNVAHEIGDHVRITKWTAELCGILIKNVTVDDEGFWVLSSNRDNDYIRGVLLVTITPKSDNEGMDGSMEKMDYCVVSRPGQLSFPTIGTCNINSDDAGEWTIRKGFQGQTTEIVEEIYNDPLGKGFT